MDWCCTQLACFQASFMESPWTRPAPASLSTGVSYIPRAECGTEVSFGKSSFNIFPYYLCAPHAGVVFLLLFPPYSGCLFLLLKPDDSWRIRSWFSSCAEIPENVSVGFDCVVCAFANVGVCQCCKTGISSLRLVKNFFCPSGRAALVQMCCCWDNFLSSSVMQLYFESKSSAKVKVKYLRKLNQKK